MGLIKGLANISARVEADEAKYSNTDYVQAKWFKISDKQAVTVQFLQELDESNPGYSEKNGLGVMAVEHNNPAPGLWKNKAVCSFDDEGRCYGCEKHAQDPKAGWKQKTKLYINVLVDDGNNEPYVAVLSSGMGKGQVAPTLIEILTDVEEGEEPVSLTKTKFRIKRSGSGLSDTNYTVTQKGEAKNDPEQYELFDLDKVLRQPAYVEQEAHYNRGAAPASSEKELEPAGAGNAAAEEW